MIEPRTDIISKDKPQPDKDLRATVKCLKCQKKFKSANRTTNRICGNCKSRGDTSGGWMESAYGWSV